MKQSVITAGLLLAATGAGWQLPLNNRSLCTPSTGLVTLSVTQNRADQYVGTFKVQPLTCNAPPNNCGNTCYWCVTGVLDIYWGAQWIGFLGGVPGGSDFDLPCGSSGNIE